MAIRTNPRFEFLSAWMAFFPFLWSVLNKMWTKKKKDSNQSFQEHFPSATTVISNRKLLMNRHSKTLLSLQRFYEARRVEFPQVILARPPFYSKVLANFIVRAPSSFSEFLRSLESFRGNIDGVLTGPSIVSPIPTCIAICYLINIDYCDRLNWVSKPTAHDVSKWSPVRILTVYSSIGILAGETSFVHSS